MKVQELFEEEERSVLSVMGKQPEHETHKFDCSGRKLTSLEGSPSSVDNEFSCSYNRITSLKGAPSSVNRNFYCNSNKLTSLEGAPSKIGGHFCCSNNNLTSLHNIHKHIKHIGGCAEFEDTPIESHILGLLLIDGLTEVWIDNKQVQKIINKYLSGDRDVFACQEELIENGFDDFAQL